MSFDVYMSTRGGETINSGGFTNKWSTNPREKWIATNYSDATRCVDSTTGREFTRKMVPLLKAAIQRRIASSPAVFARVMKDWI